MAIMIFINAEFFYKDTFSNVISGKDLFTKDTL